MAPIAIGRLNQHGVGLARRLRRTQNRVAWTPKVTAYENPSRRWARECELDHRRAEDVAGRTKDCLHTPGDFDACMKGYLAEILECTTGIFFSVERQGGRILREALAIRVARILFLKVAAVGEDDPTKNVCPRSRVNRAAETVAQKAREISGVVDVRVRQHHDVDCGGSDWESGP